MSSWLLHKASGALCWEKVGSPCKAHEKEHRFSPLGTFLTPSPHPGPSNRNPKAEFSSTEAKIQANTSGTKNDGLLALLQQDWLARPDKGSGLALTHPPESAERSSLSLGQENRDRPSPIKAGGLTVSRPFLIREREQSPQGEEWETIGT